MRYLARRAVWTVLAVLGVSVLIFLLVRLLPGNIVDIIAGTEGQLGRAQRAAVLREFGLDQPLPVQYFLWLGNMLQGNFGWSFRTGQPVAALIVSRLPITIELALLAVLSVAFVGHPARRGGERLAERPRADAGPDRGRPGAVPAELLDRHPAHHRRVVALRLAAGPDLRHPVGGSVGEPPADVPARAVAVAGALGGRRAHDPVVDARGAGAGLHPGRPRQGAGHAGDPPASRAPERPGPDRHGPRASRPGSCSAGS